jgi:uncharacterized membrane protein YeiB
MIFRDGQTRPIVSPSDFPSIPKERSFRPSGAEKIQDLPVSGDIPVDGASVEAAAPMLIVRDERSLAPDIARGLLLMFIAMANITGFHVGYVGEEPRVSVLDRIIAGFEEMFVNDHSRPMFAVLFGFGLAMMASRMAAKGVNEREVRRVLRRRSLWLLLFGVLHAAFLWTGDILGPYGVTGLIALRLVNRSNQVLRRWFWVSVPLQTAGTFGVLMLFLRAESDGGQGPERITSYQDYMIEGLAIQGITDFMSAAFLLFLPLVIVGFWLFRSGWLTHPEEHLPQLRQVFWRTMVANIVLSIPIVLLSADV